MCIRILTESQKNFTKAATIAAFPFLQRILSFLLRFFTQDLPFAHVI